MRGSQRYKRPQPAPQPDEWLGTVGPGGPGGHGSHGMGHGGGGSGGGGKPNQLTTGIAKPAGAGGGGGGHAPNPVPAPVLPSSAAANQAASADYERALASYQHGVYQAAMDYGDPAVMNQQALLGYGPAVQDNPLSALDRIQRDETQARTNLNEGENANNTFFSGLNLRDQTKLGDQARLQRTQAYQDYLNASADFQQQLTAAMDARNSTFGASGAADIEAALAKPPEPKLPGHGGGGGGGSGGSGGGGGGNNNGGGHGHQGPYEGGPKTGRPNLKKRR